MKPNPRAARTIAATALLALACLAASHVQAADLVVVGNPAAAPLTRDQVADIFLGKDQSHAPVDLSDASPLRAEFYKKATGRDPSQVKAAWSRLVFSGKAQPPKEVADPAAVKKAVAADPKAVGYMDKASIDGTVKVLATID